MNKEELVPTLVPRLRFPEFRDTLGWTERPLGELVQTIVREREKPLGLYTRLGVRSHGKGTFLKEFEQPEKNSMTHLYEVDVDDLIVNITFAWEGAIAIVNPEDAGALVSHRFPTYVFDRNKALPEFFRYPILDKRFIYNLGVISPGGAGRNRVLNRTDFLKLKIATPTVAEQRKVADFLGSLDDIIAAEGRKMALLRSLKQGLMQQLFPRESESQPQLRFIEFRNAEPWTRQPFSSLYGFKPNNNYSRNQLNYDVGRVKNIHYGDIHTRFASRFFINAEKVPYVNPGVLPDNIDPETFCRPGDLVFADASENLADVGKCIEIIDVGAECLISGSHTILARPRSSLITVGFAGYLLDSHCCRSGIEREAQGTKVVQISPTRLSRIDVFFPPNTTEQQRIADCLSALDDRIAAQTEKLDALRAHKHGLMQQLFPSIEDET